MSKNYKPTAVFLLVILAFVVQTAKADGILLSWSGRDVQGVTEQSFNEARKLKAEQIPAKNLKVASWADAYLLIVASTPNKDDKNFLRAMTAQLSDRSTVVLKGTSRLIIWERIISGEILFEGKGYQVDDDLFSVAGRANWILRSLTKKNFGYVKANSGADELGKLQQKWTKFLNGESVDEFQNPYETAEKGLSEIRSLEALEGLIVSLGPSEIKDKTTKDCLKKIYGLNELPKEPGPASMCSPDTMTNLYLSTLTGIKEKNSFDWWKTWWVNNRGRLIWNKSTGTFEVKK